MSCDDRPPRSAAEPIRARTLASVVRDGKGQVAERVRLSLAETAGHSDGNAEALTSTGTGARKRGPAVLWLRPLAGFGIAAGVAALSIFWLELLTSPR